MYAPSVFKKAHHIRDESRPTKVDGQKSQPTVRQNFVGRYCPPSKIGCCRPIFLVRVTYRL